MSQILVQLSVSLRWYKFNYLLNIFFQDSISSHHRWELNSWAEKKFYDLRWNSSFFRFVHLLLFTEIHSHSTKICLNSLPTLKSLSTHSAIFYVDFQKENLNARWWVSRLHSLMFASLNFTSPTTAVRTLTNEIENQQNSENFISSHSSASASGTFYCHEIDKFAVNGIVESSFAVKTFSITSHLFMLFSRVCCRFVIKRTEST